MIEPERHAPTSPEFLRYLQDVTQRATQEMWRQMPWRKKMRARWYRLRHIWGPP